LLVYDPEKRPTASEALRHQWLRREFSLKDRRPDERLMNIVHNALIQSAKDSRFKKLAMMIIAYNSSAKEIEELREAFDQYDADNNGTITYWEFRKALSACNFSEAELKKMFAELDVNETGVINYSEFLAATLETRGRIEEERIAEAFDKLDIDQSGYISKENLCSVLGSKCTAKDCDMLVDELMKEVDENKDGRISYEEFMSMFRSKHKKRVETVCCRMTGTGGKCR
jgi:Ca2+-binding EF-hand superfamily protein